MTAETRDRLMLVTSPPPSTLELVASASRRADEAQAESTTLRAEVARLTQWLNYEQHEALAERERLGALRTENAHLAEQAHQARRDQWLTIVVAVAVVLLFALFCAVVLVLRP